MGRISTSLRKQRLRYLSALAMVLPAMGMRVACNRLKGVRIGAEPWMGVLAYLDIHHSHPQRRTSLVIGDRVAIGPFVTIYTHDSLYFRITAGRDEVRFGRVVIGDDVNVSTHAFIYNCTIGSNSIVAPHAVAVNRDFPPCSLIAGNPAEVVKDLRPKVERELGEVPATGTLFGRPFDPDALGDDPGAAARRPSPAPDGGDGQPAAEKRQTGGGRAG